MRALGLLDGDDVLIVPPRPATEDELLTVHTREFVNAVKRAEPNPRYGLGTDDVPVVPGMHEACSLVVGATLTAAELVMTGQAKRAFNISGGLHHAHRNQASGFCIYNDLAVAIRYMQKQHGARVMYIDYDAHHGDGVQSIFYQDPGVLTVSLHESGMYLFPGTGFVDEIGEAEGYGYAVNAPLEPDTGDTSFSAAFRDLVPALAEVFKPDVIVLQTGCDAHALDPLTHLQCSTRIYEELTRVVCDVADQHCAGRVVATGGGGYAVHEVVPRAWSLVWSALRGVEPGNELPPAWIQEVEREAGRPLVRTLRDDPGDVDAGGPNPNNDRSVRAVKAKVLPIITGWGLAF
jgi:acetoin utilization protein AcuC